MKKWSIVLLVMVSCLHANAGSTAKELLGENSSYKMEAPIEIQGFLVDTTSFLGFEDYKSIGEECNIAIHAGGGHLGTPVYYSHLLAGYTITSVELKVKEKPAIDDGSIESWFSSTGKLEIHTTFSSGAGFWKSKKVEVATCMYR